MELALGARLEPPDISAGYAPLSGGAWRDYGVGELVTLTLANSGGAATGFSASAGLPSWLALYPDGTLNGTASAAGTHAFTVTAAAAAGASTTWVQLVVTQCAAHHPTYT